MSDKSNIEWCDSTFNPWVGCTKVGPGCDHCYAEADFDLRRHRVKWGPGNPRSRTSPANWKKPLQWNAKPFYECRCCGWRGDSSDKEFSTPRQGCIHDLMPSRRRVFCASLADVFDNDVPREWRYDLLWLISNTPNLDWLLLTKRIGNAHRMLEDECSRMGFPWSLERWPHVWLGATIVNQEEADRDIPKLLAVPAAVRFLSMEPLLGPVNLTRAIGCKNCGGRGYVDVGEDVQPCEASGRGQHAESIGELLSDLDWVVVGGESRTNARPMHPDWARSLRDQCAAAGVPMLFKQWGEWLPDNQNPTVAPPHDPNGAIRVGKKAAGRLLDGVLHNGYPETRP